VIAAAPAIALAPPPPAEIQAVESLNAAIAGIRDNLLAVPPLVAGLVLIVLGVGLLVCGFPLYKWLVIVIFAGVGFFVGMAAGAALGVNPVIGMIAGALVLGLLAWPLVRAGWALVGGGAFALVFCGFAAASGVTTAAYLYIIGGVAFVAGLVTTFILFRPLIIIVTSAAGAGMLVQGTMQALTALWPATGEQMVILVRDRPWIFAAVVVPLATLGAILQFREKTPLGEGRKAKKAAKPEKEEKE